MIHDPSGAPVDHEYRILARRERFVGPVFRVVSDRVTMPGGGEATRDVVLHLGVVAVVARDPLGRIALIQQYRHPVGRRMWELPAGLMDNSSESPEAAARRELREETGLIAGEMAPLIALHASPGYSDEFVMIFVTSVRTDAGRDQQASAVRLHDEELEITWDWVTPEACLKMIARGEITNAICQVGVFATVNLLGGVRIGDFHQEGDDIRVLE